MNKQSFIVGDAGGTSTQWRIVRDGKISQFETNGFNAYTHKIKDFKKSIQEAIQENTLHDLPVFFYAAGVDTLEQKNEVENELREIFINEVTVENDLLAAARSLCGNEAGNICILGTGANACFYNGIQVNKVSASLGYVLGDEGSGAYMGKKLLAKVFRDQMDLELIEKFNNQYGLTSHQVIQKIYNEPKPNHLLASFAPFLYENRNHPEVYKLVQDALMEFFDAFYARSVKEEFPFHFSGSIAFFFSDILRQVGADRGFSIKNIVQSPIAGLVLYHQEND